MKKKRKLKKFIKVIYVIIVLIIGLKIGHQLLNKAEYINNDILKEEKNNVIKSKNTTYDDVSILKTKNGTILDRLNELSGDDKRIKYIIDNYDNYPENLLEALSHNIEMLDFVLNYSNKKDKVYSSSVEDIEKGAIPLLLQYDERWGYGNYGKSNVAISGCGPTSLAMVVVGLTGNRKITPYVVAKFAEENGYYLNDSGTTWDLMSKGAKYFNLQSRELPLSKSVIFNALNNEHPIICSMRRGDFTINGHYIVLTGIEDGKIKVNDPNSKARSSILWEYERIQSQIKNLWEFYL